MSYSTDHPKFEPLQSTTVILTPAAVDWYALTWTLFDSQIPEWALFLFLGLAPGQHLPPGPRLVVRDATATLADQTLAQEATASYLYAQVIGTWDDLFTATVGIPHGPPRHRPPFVFRPEAPLS